MWDCFVETCVAMTELDPEDNLVWDKVAALMRVNAIIRAYASEGYEAETLLRPIAEKKIAFIKAATSQSALRDILEPPKVRYDFNKVHPFGAFCIPEEELVIWSMTSYKGPLIHAGFERMMELMAQIYPEVEF